MANGYYYQDSPSPYSVAPYNRAPPFPLHLLFFLLTLLLFISLSWYLSYESALESLADNIKLFFMLLPLGLLLAVHWLSDGTDRRQFPFIIGFPDRDALHRAGGSPWGVGLLLVLLMFMISYQSYFHAQWFPLFSR